ncbi:hypothetical protein Hanom_Chr09g00809001 [Helianthus anomalus]
MNQPLPYSCKPSFKNCLIVCLFLQIFLKLFQKLEIMGEVRWRREQQRARERLNEVITIFKEAKQAKRWDDGRKCYLDPQGNPTMDPKTTDFNALVAAIPTAEEFYSKIKVVKIYEEEVEKRIRMVIYASPEKSIEKNVEETIAEKQKRMDENL